MKEFPAFTDEEGSLSVYDTNIESAAQLFMILEVWHKNNCIP
jgi:hypothetical protein